MQQTELLPINLNLRVVVTAGASGIGKTIANAFSKTGSKVLVCDISEQAVEEFNEENSGVAVRADVSDVHQMELFFVEAKRRLGGLDVLVNNAGIAGPTAPIEDIDPIDWEKTVSVNLNGLFYCTKFALPLLKQAKGGSIINIASSAAMKGYPLRSPYSATKWAMIGMTKTIAMEAGSFNIRVNAICPGSVKGPRIEQVIKNDAKIRGVAPEIIRQTYLNQVSLRTFVDAQDIANTAIYLASKYGKNISGQTIGVDGHTESLSNPTNLKNEEY